MPNHQTNPFLLLLLAATLCFCNLHCKQKENNTAKINKRPDFVVVNNQKYAVETILNMKTDELKAFVKAAIADEIPAGYQVPDYILQGTDIDAMYKVFWTRYPQFAGLKADALITEVSMNPDIYIDMITENKALRKKVERIDSLEFAKQKEIMKQQKQNK